MAVVPLPLGPAPSVTVSAVAPGGTYGLRKIVPPTAGPCKPAPPAP
jgi:hypothetical protein